MRPGPLADSAIVLRGGSLRDIQKIGAKVEAAHHRGVGPVLSVWCDESHPGESREQTLMRISLDAGIPHPKIMTSTVGELRARGFEFELDTSDGQSQYHYHVLFELPVRDSQVQAFIETFGMPEPNPTGGR